MIGKFVPVLVIGALALGASALKADALTSPVALDAKPSVGALTCRAGSKRAVIGGKVKCLRVGQACVTRYQRIYKRHGFTCVGGHLRKIAPSPAPPPPPAPPPAPPPPPPAQPGHYKGQTSQLTSFEFDVTATGAGVTNLVTGQINEGCNPPAHLSGGTLDLGAFVASVGADGRFTIDFNYTGTVGDVPSSGRITITGQFSASTATGTLQKTTAFTFEGTAYSCGSGLQTWTASKTG